MCLVCKDTYMTGLWRNWLTIIFKQNLVSSWTHIHTFSSLEAVWGYNWANHMQMHLYGWLHRSLHIHTSWSCSSVNTYLNTCSKLYVSYKCFPSFTFLIFCSIIITWRVCVCLCMQAYCDRLNSRPTHPCHCEQWTQWAEWSQAWIQ